MGECMGLPDTVDIRLGGESAPVMLGGKKVKEKSSVIGETVAVPRIEQDPQPVRSIQNCI